MRVRVNYWRAVAMLGICTLNGFLLTAPWALNLNIVFAVPIALCVGYILARLFPCLERVSDDDED